MVLIISNLNANYLNIKYEILDNGQFVYLIFNTLQRPFFNSLNQQHKGKDIFLYHANNFFKK